MHVPHEFSKFRNVFHTVSIYSVSGDPDLLTTGSVGRCAEKPCTPRSRGRCVRSRRDARVSFFTLCERAPRNAALGAAACQRRPSNRARRRRRRAHCACQWHLWQLPGQPRSDCPGVQCVRARVAATHVRAGLVQGPASSLLAVYSAITSSAVMPLSALLIFVPYRRCFGGATFSLSLSLSPPRTRATARAATRASSRPGARVRSARPATFVRRPIRRRRRVPRSSRAPTPISRRRVSVGSDGSH
jgi:hypothetical protein